MPARLRPVDPAAVADALAAVTAAVAADEQPARADLRLLTKHYLALLEATAPGRSVEVRVPPFAAVQVVEGVRHTRGTPPAVVETDPLTWVRLATGTLDWAAAVADGAVVASGERADLSSYLPIDG